VPGGRHPAGHLHPDAGGLCIKAERMVLPARLNICERPSLLEEGRSILYN